MIEIDKGVVTGWEATIRGMRNPMNSWDKSDSYSAVNCGKCGIVDRDGFCDPKINRPVGGCPKEFECFEIGPNDLDLMKRLVKAGTDHSKFMRYITVTMDVNAPLYWWKEFDTYKVGTVANSCSTMHKIQAKEFTMDDFSHEHLIEDGTGWVKDENGDCWCCAPTLLETIVKTLNAYRYQYIETKDKKYWWQMIQLLPNSYNQKRTIQLNYAVLRNMYFARKNHKLDEWKNFCAWIETLPYSELITGE